jgi:hypothetical protein
MKYYDSMGADVSAYVEGLEAKIKKLEAPVFVKVEVAKSSSKKK